MPIPHLVESYYTFLLALHSSTAHERDLWTDLANKLSLEHIKVATEVRGFNKFDT